MKPRRLSRPGHDQGFTRTWRASRLWLGGALCLAVTSANAADLPLRRDPIEPALPTIAAFSWTGIYAGVEAGYDWDHDHLVESVTATGVPTGSVYRYRPDGFSGGGHVGADYQMDSIVVGAVADFEGTTIRGTFVDPSGIGKGHDTLPWQGSVRARLGYALGDVMVYATGGLAYADLKNTYVYVPTATSETFSKVVTGWTAGGGVAFALTDNWVISAEYRFSEYGRYKNNSTVAFPGLSATQDYSANAARIAVSYKF